MKTGLLYGIVANSKTRVRCVFCGVYIPKANKCIEQHVNGTKHKENIELMSENGISFTGDDIYCKPCKRNLVDEESVGKHIEDEDHATWMVAVEELVDGEFVNLEPFLSSEKEDVVCEACNCSIGCSLPSLQEHVNCYNHRLNLSEKLKPLNGIFPTENSEEVWCKVCDEYIENMVTSILDHIDEDGQHIEWFDEMEDLIEDQGVSLETYLANEHEVNAYCTKCQMSILCNSDSIESHVNSDSHLNNVTQVSN